MKKETRFVLSLYLFLFALTGHGEETPQQTLNFQQTLQLALQNSPTLQSFKAEQENRSMELKNATSAFFPSLDLSTTHGAENSAPPTSSNPWASEIRLALTERLYDNGESITKYQIAKLRKKRADLSFVNERDKICLEVALEYFNYSRLTKFYAIQESRYQTLQRQYQNVVSQYRQGLKTKKDFLRFETQVRRAKIELISSQTSIEKSKQDLIRLINTKAGAVSFSPDDSDIKSVNDIKIDPLLVENHREYSLASMRREENQLEVDFSRRKYWPEVSLNSAVTYVNQDYIGNGQPFSQSDQINWQILLTVQYNLWDWGIRKRNLSISINEEKIKNSQIDIEILRLKSDLSKLSLDLKKLKENYKLSKELLKLEEKSYEVLESDYRRGKTSYLDLINSLDALFEAKNKFYSSLYDLKESMHSYWYHQGKIYEKLI